jgi:ankyrin repeat protein
MPIHLASGAAEPSLVGALLEAGADANAVTTASGVTPLHLAAKAFNGESTIRVLIEHGARVNALESSSGQTPLMFASSFGRTPSVRELLDHGADPAISTKVVDVLKRMVIDQAAQARLREAQLEIGASPDGTRPVLTPTQAQAAIGSQREFLRSEEEIAELLMDFHSDDLSSTRLYRATEVEYKARPWFETLVGRTGGLTALLHAAREGHIEVVETLLDHGADVDQVAGGDGSSPLVSAVQNGHFDLSLVLLERGADPNLATNTDNVAALFGVLQTQWANFTSHPQPRAHEYQDSTYMEVLKALVEAGADPNISITRHLWYWEFSVGRVGLDITGATPFWRAAFALDVEAMKLLASHGADPSVPTRWDEVGMRGTRQEDGRSGDDSGLSPLAEGTSNMYPIHAAAGGGWLGFVAVDMRQVPNNFFNAVKYLVEEHGADVSVPNSWGYTPLHYAAARGDNDLIEYLLSKGADLSVVSRLGQSTVDMARGGGAGYHKRAGFPETVDFLLSLGAEFRCIDTHFRATGAYCAGSGVPPFEGAIIPAP